MHTLKNHSICIIFSISLLAGLMAQAADFMPYEVDADTLHLYHFDGDGTDAVTADPAHLSLYDGAATNGISISGFDRALNTYDGVTGGGPYTSTGAYPGALPITNFIGSDGAFTFEAIIMPMVGPGSIPNHMEIICADSGISAAARAWQFRINTGGNLEWANIMGGGDLIVPIPTSGANAYAAGKWYHVAVTYNGDASDAGSLRLYWTKLNSGVTEANLIGMTQGEDFANNVNVFFCVGNELRAGNGFTENFEGFIDEVRISRVARAAGEMIFGLSPDMPNVVSHPADQIREEAEAASFEVEFTSLTYPIVQWYKQTEEGEVELNSSDANVSMRLEYDSVLKRYRTTLTLAAVTMADGGSYYAEVINIAGPAISQAAVLTVKGLWAHWTMDQEDFDGSHYRDIMGGHDAIIGGSAAFVAGADGAGNGAALIGAAGGWAQLGPIAPAQYTGGYTISYWANWQPGMEGRDDFVMTSDNGSALTVADGLRSDGRWQHICTVFDGENVRLYLDGALQGEVAWPLATQTEAYLSIGHAGEGADRFDGAIDDVRIYNYALTAEQMGDLRFGFSGLRSCIQHYCERCDQTGPEGEPDCQIDLYDLALFAVSYLSADTRYDLTGGAGQPDGQIDLIDFSLLCAEWLNDGLYPVIL